MKPTGVTISDLTRLETTEGLQRAVDNNFQRLIENARQEWERRFAGKAPGDDSVRVRIEAADPARERQPTPGSGFVKSSRKFEQRSNISLPRYAN